MEQSKIKISYPSDLASATMLAMQELNEMGLHQFLNRGVDENQLLIIEAKSTLDFFVLGITTCKHIINGND